MEVIREAISLLFGENGELRQIIGVTLQMSFTSTILSTCIGVPLGVFIGIRRFRTRRLILRFTHTLMGLPPVVAGLLVFFLLSRSGPLGEYKLLYSVTAMVVAQVLLITPIAVGLSSSIVSARTPLMRETAAGIGLSTPRQLLYALYECRRQLFSVFFTGFGRAISEVGAAQLVGGNVQYKTRVMTTAIVLETNKGNFALAVALGMILLIIAFLITSVAQRLQEGVDDKA
ncbi:ABC transporter permease [Christensenellaceae bacterium OttesenSCG-928-M15]|nr:ABC transporter permease [Christensenellaceae bacterium OttesenSCG-928-M15]